MLWKLIIVYFLFATFFVVSVPLHESSHLLALKLFGCKTKLQVSLFNIGLTQKGKINFGFVKPADGSNIWEFPAYYSRSRTKLFFFIALLAGGFGSAILLLSLFFILPVAYKHIWSVPLFSVILFQFTYGMFEAITTIKQIQIIP